jgi:uncharacterized protein (DUF1684 family)
MRLLAGMAAVVLAASAALPPDYVQQIEQWRQKREQRLKSDTGWLTVAGLYWLHEGENKIDLPRGATATFVLHDGKVTHDGAEMKADVTEHPTELKMGDLTLYVIERAGRYGIRLKDKDSEYRRNFTGLKWYPVRPEYRVEARFVAEPKKIPILNIVGQTDNEDSPGYVEFTLHGQRLRMVALTEEDTLFFVFRDKTSGKTTYGASRMLNTPMPKDGRVVLDFNEAYNPPCAFTPYATCPLPPRENRLPVAIEAGEKKYSNEG